MRGRWPVAVVGRVIGVAALAWTAQSWLSGDDGDSAQPDSVRIAGLTDERPSASTGARASDADLGSVDASGERNAAPAAVAAAAPDGEHRPRDGGAPALPVGTPVYGIAGHPPALRLGGIPGGPHARALPGGLGPGLRGGASSALGLASPPPTVGRWPSTGEESGMGGTVQGDQDERSTDPVSSAIRDQGSGAGTDRNEPSASLAAELPRAIAQGELRLFFQPKVAVPTEQAYGMEALLRWQHPRLGLLAPDRFIPAAEESGLIVGIGRWVLRESCRQMHEWKALFPDEPLSWVSVNLSPRQFADPDLFDDVTRTLAETGLPPHHLELEITEQVAMGDREASVRTLAALRAIGVELAVDDFGSGYSSLSYLKRLPVTGLKIDRSFVADITGEPDAAIVAAILQVARALDLKTTAEGVETAEQLAQLRRLGCQFAQGYYFARPLPPAEAAAYFERDRAAAPTAAERSTT